MQPDRNRKISRTSRRRPVRSPQNQNQWPHRNQLATRWSWKSLNLLQGIHKLSPEENIYYTPNFTKHEKANVDASHKHQRSVSNKPLEIFSLSKLKPARQDKLIFSGLLSRSERLLTSSETSGMDFLLGLISGILSILL